MNLNCIIPSTCSKDALPHLIRSIGSLIASAKVANLSLKIVVVTDNKSARPAALKSKIDPFLYAGKKPGFAKMNNFGIDKTIMAESSDYYLLINDDAWLEPAFFKEFLKASKSQKPDLTVPLIYEKGGPTIDSFGIEYFTSGYAKNAPSFDIKTQLAPAACLIVKTSLLKKMKKTYGFYFNETLFSYLDDVEFSIRARALGAKIAKNKKMKAHHMVSFTAGKKSYYVMYQTYRNILWLIIMTWPFKYIARNILSIIVVQGWVFLYSLKSFGPRLYFRVLVETVRKISVLLRRRKKIMSSYPKKFNFESLFSKYAFRTYHGVTIKI